jgi:predicted transcriptional regulator
VLQALAMFMRDDKAWPSVPKIALAAGLATSTVYPYLAELECKGYLLRKKRKGQSTVYSPCIPSELDRAPWGDDDQGPGDDIRF